MMCRLAPTERCHLLGGDDTHRGNENNVARPEPEPSRWRSLGCRQPAAGSEDSDNVDSADGAFAKHRTVYVILFGQTITLALSCANAASSALENEHRIRVPTFQTGLVYFILSFHLVYLYWKQRTKRKDGDCEMAEIATHCEEELSMEDTDVPSSSHAKTRMPDRPLRHKFPFTDLSLHTPWYVYSLLAVLDVEANYLAMLSFQHTSLSSSMLLTSLSVLSTVLLRQLIFRNARYGRNRLLGVLLCLSGGMLWLRTEYYREVGDDYSESERRYGSDALDTLGLQTEQKSYAVLYGDLLALSAACLYGLNDVCAEYYVKANNDRVEYLGMLGFFGAVFSFCVQVPLIEKDQVQQLLADVQRLGSGTSSDGGYGFGGSSNIQGSALLLLLCFIILLCYFYMSVMAFLSTYDSTILNLSLQTGPLWAVLLTMLQKSVTEESHGWLAMPPATFFVSLTMVMAGMYLYEKFSAEERHENTGSDCTDEDVQYDNCST